MTTPTPTTTASAFVIRELTGQRRAVRLVGRCLPYRPLTFGVTQTAEKEKRPGNPHGSIQVLGSEEKDTKCNGTWKAKYVGEFVAVSGGPDRQQPTESAPATLNGLAVESVRELVDLFVSLCKSGQLVEVTWDAIAKRGVLKDFEHSWHNAHDVEWSAEFAWIGDAEAEAPFVTAEDNPVSKMGALRTQAAALADEALDIDLSAITGVLYGVNRLFAAVDTFLADAQTFAASAIALATTPASVLRRLAATLVAVKDTVKEIVAMVQAVPAAVATLARGVAADVRSLEYTREFPARLAARTTPPAYTDDLRARAWARGVVRGCNALLRGLEETQEQLRTAAGLRGEAVQVVVLGAAGQDVREIAQRVYGTPAEWRRIAEYNGLEGSILTTHQHLVVPRLDAPMLC